MTAKQYQASDPACSVWVAASAGTGKTKVLTDRVLRLLLQGVDPNKIVCLTFTKAAAAEMAHRIQRELGYWVLMEEDELNRYLTALIGSVPTAENLSMARKLFAIVLNIPDGLKIQNLHSFCQSLIRKFPLEAGIAPHFSVAEDQVTNELVLEVINQLMRQLDQLPPIVQGSILSIIEEVHEGRFYELIQDFTKERGKINTMLKERTSQEIIDDVYHSLQLSQGDTKEDCFNNSTIPTASLRSVARLMVEQGSKTDKERGEIILCWLSLPASQKQQAFGDYSVAFVTQEGRPRKELVTKALQKLDTVIEEVLYCEQKRVMALIDKLCAIQVAKLTTDLLQVGLYVLDLYTKAKANRAILDYHDLILIALKLLKQSDVASWVLYKLDGGIEHLLVDEAQDTSPEQWEIIEALSEEFFAGQTAQESNRTLFVVGDEKQSIYSFQGADPLVFNKMHAHFSAKIKHAEKNWYSIVLDRSFRSTEAVLKLVDTVFANKNLHKSITFQLDPIAHIVHRGGQGGKIELWPVIEKHEKQKPVPWQLPLRRMEAQNAAASLAEKIAVEISTWLKDKRTLVAKGRPVRPGDILILVQRRNILVDYIILYLKQYEIPVAGVDRMRLTEHIAVMDLIALGNFLLLPHDDLSLAVILKSPLIGFTEEQLFDLAYDRSKNLWDTLYFRQEENEIYKQAYLYLAEILNKVDHIPPFELFAYVIEAAGGRKKMIARLGAQVNDPIDEFLSLALDYEMHYIASMQGFLNWLESGTIEIKRDMDQGQDVVRIMTVHGAKGLQAPIVFLPDAADIPHSLQSFLWDEYQGNLQFLWVPRSELESSYCSGLKQSYKEKQYDEYIRLLYVALTRAEDELYIGGCKNHRVSEASWYHLIEDAMKIIGEKQGENYHYSCAQTQVIKTLPIVENEQSAEAQEELFIAHRIELERSTYIVLNPSMMEEEKNPSIMDSSKAVMRGTIVHSLLQHLPNIKKDKRQAVMSTYLNKSADLSEKEKLLISNQLLALLEDEQFQYVFSTHSKAEVPVVGKVGNYMISGVIDRLVVLENKVLVLDYKTDPIIPKEVSQIPKKYIKQMSAYLQVLEQIYPDKIIECAILWVFAPKLQKIDNFILKNAQYARES